MKTTLFFYLLVCFSVFSLLSCNRNPQNKNVDNHSDTNNTAKTESNENISLNNNSEVVPTDTMSFSYLLYLHSKNKNPCRQLAMKFLITDMPENDVEEGTYYYVDVREIYEVEKIKVIIFTLYTQTPGSQVDDTYIASFTEKGEKIDEKACNSLMMTEWNNISTSFAFTNGNTISRTSTDDTYSPENGGNTVSQSTETTEKFLIKEDGTITVLE